MAKYASKVVAQAIAWLGLNEYDSSHRKIIDVYNAHRPIARGYTVKYTDEWCATFVSAVSIILGYTDIIPTECSCGKMVGLFKKLGAWVENENRTPNPGDILFYDWQDNGNGDNTGWPDHVGIVEKVEGGKITVIEGNYSNSVKRRTIAVNAKNIRGYGVPKYDAEEKPVAEPSAPAPAPAPAKGTYTLEQFVREVQAAIGAKVDGKAGPETIDKTVTVSRYKNRTHAVVKPIQKRLYALGYTEVGKADGIAGPKFTEAVKHFQRDHGRNVDGEITAKNITWRKLLGMG